MKNTIRKAAITIGTIAITALSTPVFAGSTSAPAYSAEIDSCIAEFASHVDVSEAERVRYVVTKSKRSRLGYALKFNTSVFLSGAESYYSVYCVAKGDNTPVKFRIEVRDS
jgi:hypothetical protein